MMSSKHHHGAKIVMSGKLQVTFYDVDNSKIYEDILHKGDISILFEGGHSFKPLVKKTSILLLKYASENPSLNKFTYIG